jgi:dTDP-4-dehydrorhamnose reductase
MKLLITGASGLVGERLARDFSHNHHVLGVINSRQPQFACETRAIDFSRDARELVPLLDGFKPDAVIHCAAVSQPQLVARDPLRARAINVEAAWWLAGWCRKADRPLIAFSSDTVYPDAATSPAPAGGFSENQSPAPVNAYGASKLEMEQSIFEHFPEALVLRSSLLWGHARDGQNSFSNWLLTKQQQGGDVPVFRDNLRHPLAVSQVKQILEKLFESWPSGLLNLGSRELISREAFARKLFTYLGLDTAQLKACDTADAALLEPVPLSLPLDLSRLATLVGGRLFMVEDALAEEYPEGART